MKELLSIMSFNTERRHAKSNEDHSGDVLRCDKGPQ